MHVTLFGGTGNVGRRIANEALDRGHTIAAVEIGPGARTGRYRTTDETVLFDAHGKSFISFENYAVAVRDELERPRHVGKRFGVAY